MFEKRNINHEVENIQAPWQNVSLRNIHAVLSHCAYNFARCESNVNGVLEKRTDHRNVDIATIRKILNM